MLQLVQHLQARSRIALSNVPEGMPTAGKQTQLPAPVPRLPSSPRLHPHQLQPSAACVDGCGGDPAGDFSSPALGPTAVAAAATAPLWQSHSSQET